MCLHLRYIHISVYHTIFSMKISVETACFEFNHNFIIICWALSLCWIGWNSHLGFSYPLSIDLNSNEAEGLSKLFFFPLDQTVLHFLTFSIYCCVLALISARLKIFFPLKIIPPTPFFFCLPPLLCYNGIWQYSLVHFIHGYIHDLIAQLFFRIQPEKLFFILNIS